MPKGRSSARRLGALALLGLAVGASPAAARFAPTAGRFAPGYPQRLAACAGILNDLRRLTCFDVLASDSAHRRVRLASLPATRRHDYATSPRAPSPASENCFMFNGERVCE